MSNFMKLLFDSNVPKRDWFLPSLGQASILLRPFESRCQNNLNDFTKTSIVRLTILRNSRSRYELHWVVVLLNSWYMHFKSKLCQVEIIFFFIWIYYSLDISIISITTFRKNCIRRVLIFYKARYKTLE